MNHSTLDHDQAMAHISYYQQAAGAAAERGNFTAEADLLARYHRACVTLLRLAQPFDADAQMRAAKRLDKHKRLAAHYECELARLQVPAHCTPERVAQRAADKGVVL